MGSTGLEVPVATPPAVGAPTAAAAADAVDRDVVDPGVVDAGVDDDGFDAAAEAPATPKAVLPQDIKTLAVALDQLTQCHGPGLDAAQISSLIAESQVFAHRACRTACEACVLSHKYYYNLNERRKTKGPLAGLFDDAERNRRRQIISKALPVLRDFLVVRAASIHGTKEKDVISTLLTDMLGEDTEGFRKDLISKLLNAHRHVLTKLPDPPQPQGAQEPQPEEARQPGLQPAAASSSSSSSSAPPQRISILEGISPLEDPTAQDTHGDHALHPADGRRLPHHVAGNPPRELAPGPAGAYSPPPPAPVWDSFVFLSPHFAPLDAGCASMFCSGGALCACGQCG